METIHSKTTSECDHSLYRRLSDETLLESAFDKDDQQIGDDLPAQEPWQEQLRMLDLQLKKRIRALKIASRIVAVFLSLATLVPLLMTIAKFVATRNVYFDVNGQQRNAWANETITLYTYLYTGMTSLSLLLDISVIIAYFTERGFRNANRTALVSSIWSWAILLTNIIIWSISVSVYRYGREPVDGKYRDLWGWTCSSAAHDLQDVLPSVDFDKYCTIQTTSFYTGIVNVAAGTLSATILCLALRRKQSKQRLRRATFKATSS